MRRMKLIGIGAGNPDHITLQAINSLAQVDVVFVIDKGDSSTELMRARREICDRFMQERPHRIVEIRDAERDRESVTYREAVTSWHAKRAEIYERVIREELAEHECGAFLIWGDPALYDSTLRIINLVVAMNTVAFDWEVIPGISSIQALAAAHRISWNDIGAPVHITTGRRLNEDPPATDATVLVMLDGQFAFNSYVDDNIDIYWGAYLGTPDEILLSGRLGDQRKNIEQVRTEARTRKGWIMDAYLLRKRGPPQ